MDKLNSGINIISEDYRGTGLAWSRAKGLAGEEYKILDRINSDILAEDIVFLFDGEPFSTAIEKNHLHETNNELMKRCRKTHLEVGKEKGWIKINSNQDKEIVFNDILKILKEKHVFSKII
jgi:thymidylate kinase